MAASARHPPLRFRSGIAQFQEENFGAENSVTIVVQKYLSMTNPKQQPTKNQIGQAMYRKGLERRQALIDATAALLKTTSLTDLKVVDIARTAGTSKPNFYLYFSDVRDAVLATVQRISMATPAILDIVEGDWPEGDVEPRARRFVSAYLRYHQTQSHVLRVRTALAAEGDVQFQDAERMANERLLEILTNKIATHQARHPELRKVHPASGAGAILASLDRLGSYGPFPKNELKITNKTMVDAVCVMIANLLEPPL